MTESMIEKVARAIYDAADKEDYVSDYRFHGGDTCFDGHFNLNALARAAIQAMREPTEGMRDAATGLGTDYEIEPGVPVSWPPDIDTMWQAMINSALTDGAREYAGSEVGTVPLAKHDLPPVEMVRAVKAAWERLDMRAEDPTSLAAVACRAAMEYLLKEGKIDWLLVEHF